MKKILPVILSFFFSASTAKAQGYPNTVDEDGNIVGQTSMAAIERNRGNAWFSGEYNNYNPNSSALDVLRNLPAGTTFLVFGGGWCEDTRKLLPRFMKVTDLCKMPRTNITLYFLGKNKTSPAGLESQYGITNIPTFIILRNGREIGRITESVSTSVENDLVEISGAANK